ncbi:putative disease resistance protein RGA3 isoform X3 [Quercus robur]|uniref:putative disease resistance protein RGA3 isoform X3 n=1 Tax=Quercus robur TaxID=38942 RepID=UPI002163E1B4|nr:putative disease resistance protein RGA3 isoform X3 [Quercus robur]XP_050284777.1 putative disease resistance protein RGA3 isoform X3 [Quercus robur]XP_050284778.1 putative disease resistance protein RGA3 isoform X3 [Quercus robur]XP_050284779.1 putative disease resistance protein RGA3 isoform X3 [Quercus robur]XP_050284781.1 putative disease resistance protein RGA3 isoform X3 [Quercus robur]XP_050284782.1 putative disease resistance protein RGA3 isoform X3 [Quercus robur]XP_050284783.1 pu
MAEAILFGLAQKMIENLGSQTFQEFGSLWGVEGELEKIKETVSTIQAVLQDAAEQRSHNNQVKLWLEKLNDAVYDADDLLSEFSTEATRRSMVSGNKVAKEVRTCLSCSNPLAFRYKMSRKIKAMRQKLNAIAEDKNNFNLKVDNVETNDMSRKRETHSFVREEDVIIGRDKDKNNIIDLLFDSNVEEDVSVIPIVGIGGLGKTTLAKYVYNDEKVQKYFDLKMWACISDVFDLKVIIENIIASTCNAPVGNLRIEQLQSQLREKIDKKKYLLVLDDLWNDDRENWRELKSLLMGGSKGSKIIITSRIRLVAEITRTVPPYFLQGLSEEQSWDLFRQVAFRKVQEANNPKLMAIGREIVNMCQGVPLAIRSIGNVLYLEEKESEWSSVKDDIKANVIQGNEILPILKLSYDHLPSHLKSCFTYCSLFPKDYEMDKKTVIQLWIAQGFVPPSNKNQQLEDVGEVYFKDLLWRSFFEKVETYKGLRYKMHDLIHDLAEAVAGKECKLVSFDDKNINEKNRHVSCPFFIDMSFIETLKSSLKSNKIRTFLQTCEMYGSNALDESMLNTLILSFSCLRALDLHKLGITRVPNSIGKLIHLKYLDLSFNWAIETLPDSITTLLNLQVLKLYDCKGLKELPKKFRELVNLKHLYNDGCDNLSHMPCGLGQMTSLQTLQLFIVSTSSHIGGLGELKELNNLRGTLEISHLGRLEETNSESIVVNLREKQHLEKLILKWYYQDQVDNNEDEKLLEDLQPHENLKYFEVYQYKGVKFSSWVSSHTNLVDLSIESCKRCRYLPPLSHLPSLKSLRLGTMNDLEYISDKDMSKGVASSTTLSTTFFPSLKSLTIKECPNLKGWWGRTGRDLVATTSASTPDHQQDQSHNSLPLFPLLSSLRISYCPEMTSMPLFPNLEESLCLYNVSLKPLQETMSVSYSSLSSSSPLSKLNDMTLFSIEDIESLPAEWALHSLKELYIENCPRLTSMSGAVRNLTSLCLLSIVDCEEFDPFRDMHDDGMEWRCLNCLRDLFFKGIPKLKSLPVGLQCISTLKELRISNCPNLMTLPELTSLEYFGIARCEPNLTSLLEISCLTSLRLLRIMGFPNLITFPESIRNPISLEKLSIWGCPNLTTLPDDGCLKSLQKLQIVECPQLEEKYKNKIDKDFPNLEIRWE